MRRFTSPLADRMVAFIKLKRALGYRYETAEAELLRFDRYVADLSSPGDVMTREIVHGWLGAKPHLSPFTQRGRTTTLRQFCLYLVRLDARTYVPDRALFPTRLPTFKGYVYSHDEMRALLRAASELAPLKWALHPKTVHTMLLVLYATGLRAGEIEGLGVGDVDLDACTLFIRQTKFFKSRLVPFSPALGDRLGRYFQDRAARGPAAADAPFFINRYRRAFTGSKLSAIFHGLVRAVGIASRPGAHGPRLHDLRRTFAVHRVIRWYREGADVQAKLPLLATYMGHGTVAATHVYLTATAELLQEASGRFERSFGELISTPTEVSHAIS